MTKRAYYIAGLVAGIKHAADSDTKRNRILAPMLAHQVAGAGITAPYLGLIQRYLRGSGVSADSAHYKTLIDQAVSHGATARPIIVEHPAVTLLRGSKPRLAKFMETIGHAYNPATNTIYSTPSSMPHLGVVAHELGHSTQQWLKPTSGRMLYALSRSLPGLSTLPVLMTSDKGKANTYANVGTAAGLPALAAELQASHRGARMLKAVPRSALGRLGRLSAFVGVPTYAATTLSPRLAYTVKSRMGGYTQ